MILEEQRNKLFRNYIFPGILLNFSFIQPNKYTHDIRTITLYRQSCIFSAYYYASSRSSLSYLKRTMISCITIPIVCTCTNQPQNYYIVYVTLVMVKYSQLHVYGHQPLCTLIYLLCTKKHNYLYCCNLLYIRKYSVCMRNN